MSRTDRALAIVCAALLAMAAAQPALAQQGGQQQAPRQQGSGPMVGASDAPIEIASDRLEVRERENIAVFTGNVQLVQDKLTLRTVRMVVHYANQGEGGSVSGSTTEVERIEAEGKVYLKSGNQVATGDKGHFDMKADQMVLTGSEVVLTEGENVVRGCRLTMKMSTGESQVDGCGGGSGGRVIMLLQPGSQNSQ